MIYMTKFTTFLLALLVLSVAAQAQQGAPTAAPGKGKIAVVNTAAFQEGIGEFRAKLEALNKQFEPRIKDLEQLSGRIQSIENTINTQRNALTPAKVAELTEQMETLKREYQRKSEDLQADGNRARDLALQPISEKLEKFAQGYTARKGITVLVDAANAVNSGILLWYDPRLDMTEDFVKEYNKANPAPGAAPAPPK
ncbi:MAG: OmpH family outer membrane protein [Acidobacteria bacterium]|nr:OmpH family outer membrane protein [Acidobacteriota bacterium]